MQHNEVLVDLASISNGFRDIIGLVVENGVSAQPTNLFSQKYDGACHGHISEEGIGPRKPIRLKCCLQSRNIFRQKLRQGATLSG